MAAVGPAASVEPARSSVPRWVWPALVGAVLLGATASKLLQPAGEVPDSSPVVQFELDFADDPLAGVRQRSLALSPDGSRLFHVGRDGLRLRLSESIQRSAHVQDASEPRDLFFSPDGAFLGYWDWSRDLLMRMPATGGTPSQITAVNAGSWGGARWGHDGYIYVGLLDKGIGRVRETGGPVESLLDGTGEGFVHAYPSLLPDGRSVLYTRIPDAGNWDEAELRLYDMRSEDDRLLHTGGTDATYLATGHVVFVSRGTLFAAELDLGRGELRSFPAPVMDHVRRVSSPGGATQYAVSDNGTLVKYREWSSSGLTQSEGLQLTWVGGGTEAPLTPNLRSYVGPKVQPTGEYVAVHTGDMTGPNRTLWLLDAVRGTQTMVQEGAGLPVWSRDGRRLAYGSGRHILVRDMDTFDRVDTLWSGEMDVDPTDWSPDGRYILFNLEREQMTQTSVGVLDLETGQAEAFIENDMDADYARFSPDGEWLAYEYGSVGEHYTVIRRFPSGRDAIVLNELGGKPVFGREAGVLFTHGPANTVMQSRIDFEERSASRPELVSGLVQPYLGMYDVHPLDGRLLVVADPTADQTQSESQLRHKVDVVINWASTLPRKGGGR